MTTICNVSWEKCWKCKEYMPSDQLTLDRELNRFLCDVCLYERYSEKERNNEKRSTEKEKTK